MIDNSMVELAFLVQIQTDEFARFDKQCLEQSGGVHGAQAWVKNKIAALVHQSPSAQSITELASEFENVIVIPLIRRKENKEVKCATEPAK